MLRHFGVILYLWSICSPLESLDFPFWDHCEQLKTDCDLPLGSQRFAVGSGYEPGSSEWYLIGGQITNSFFYTATVAVINITSISESLTGYQCLNTYASNLPRGITQSAGAVINGQLYSFGGFIESRGNYSHINTTYNSNTSTQSPFSMS